MQKILIIVHAAPHGSERCLSALRLATALVGRDGECPELSLFLMSDAVVAGLPNQRDGNANAMQTMLEQLVEEGVPIMMCRTCVLARGMADLPLIPGVTIATLPELAELTMNADKVVTF